MTLTELKDIIRKGFEEGSQQKEFKTIKTNEIYVRYGYKANPLKRIDVYKPLFNEELEFFLGRNKELEFITSNINLNLEKPLHISLVGCKGIGKRTIAKVICKVFSEEFPEVSTAYYGKEYDYKNSKNLTNEEFTELNNQPIEIRFIEGRGLQQQLKAISQKTKVLFSIWNNSEYPNNLGENKRIYIRNFPSEDIYKILTVRVLKSIKIICACIFYYFDKVFLC